MLSTIERRLRLGGRSCRETVGGSPRNAVVRIPSSRPDVEPPDAEEPPFSCPSASLDPASLVFIACRRCGDAVTLADAVRDVNGRPVCWNCGLVSLEG